MQPRPPSNPLSPPADLKKHPAPKPVSSIRFLPAAGSVPSPVVRTAFRAKRMQSDDRHRQLLRVAIEVFARHGFGGTKTRDIAAAAGVSEAILFRHFATKDDLYQAILDLKKDDSDASSRNKAAQAMMDARDDAGLFLHIADHIYQTFADDPAFQRLMLHASLEGHIIANLFRERIVFPGAQKLAKYIALRQREGAFCKCDPKIAVMFVVGAMVHFAMGRHVFGAACPLGSDGAALEQLAKLVWAGLTNKSKKHSKNHSKNHSKKTSSILVDASLLRSSVKSGSKEVRKSKPVEFRKRVLPKGSHAKS